MDSFDEFGDIEPVGLGCSLEKFTESQEIFDLILNLRTPKIDDKVYEREYERFKYVINLYKEQPQLVHPYLNGLLDEIISIVRNDEFDLSIKHKAFKYMHLITNVIGYKTIVQNLPHSASDLEPVLSLLESQDRNDTSTWETRYCLILWLSIIVKIPFHMSRLDYSQDKDHKTISDRITEVCKLYLLMRDSCRIAAAVLCAHFFTRSDIKDTYLKDFINWICEIIGGGEVDEIGPLAGLASILKVGKREDLAPLAAPLLTRLLQANLQARPYRLFRKYNIKVIQRIGLCLLRPRVTAWKYRREFRSITEGLGGAPPPQTEPPPCEEPPDIPPQTEEVIDQLIQALKDPDLTVRWCGAKGLGRVVGRLSRELADEVVGCLLELLSPREQETAWHGGCLALAELGKRGLLVVSRLGDVMPALQRALSYDERRGYSSVGAMVRDAACYVAWAFARAYDSTLLSSYLNDLACALLVATCFDREINIRRAASAAFQEHVGRQGSFPHGIEILTCADYFAVAVRGNAFLNISVFIAQYPEYTNSLIDHLVERKIEHWDIAIRELSAQALRRLAPLAPQYMSETVLPALLTKTNSIDVNARHGSLLAIGELVCALHSLSYPLNNDVSESVAGLVERAKERGQLWGASGELMKSAACHLIASLSQATSLPISDNSINVWLGVVEECICGEVSSLREAGARAIGALAGRTDAAGLAARYTSALANAPDQARRLGYTVALGRLPEAGLAAVSSDAIGALLTAATSTPHTCKWVESRRHAVATLASLITVLGLRESKGSCREHARVMLECFITGLRDYTVDDRGDTGAWVREASLSALQVGLVVAAREAPGVLTEDMVRRAARGILQQTVERIDRTRFLAAKVFTLILHGGVPWIPEREALVEVFPQGCADQESRLTSYEMFPPLASLLRFHAYTYPLLEGFIVSIGGLTESLVKNASKALFSWLGRQTIEEKERVCSVIIELFERNLEEERLTQPLGSFLELLLSSGCVGDVLSNPSSNFSSQLLRLTKAAYSNSTVKFKLLASINLYCQLIQVGGGVTRQAISKAMLLLCHRFGWVRRTVATSLFEAITMWPEAVASSPEEESSLDAALALLSETEWAVSPLETLRPIRNQLCVLLQVPVPVPVKPSQA